MSETLSRILEKKLESSLKSKKLNDFFVEIIKTSSLYKM